MSVIRFTPFGHGTLKLKTFYTTGLYIQTPEKKENAVKIRKFSDMRQHKNNSLFLPYSENRRKYKLLTLGGCPRALDENTRCTHRQTDRQTPARRGVRDTTELFSFHHLSYVTVSSV